MGKRMTKRSFIEKARKKHGNKYDYSMSFFSLVTDKIIIKCPIHGEFIQSVKGHLNSQGCKRCTGLRSYEASQKLSIN